VRLGGDEVWGAYHASSGPFIGVTYSDLGGDQRYGVVVGAELFSAK